MGFLITETDSLIKIEADPETWQQLLESVGQGVVVTLKRKEYGKQILLMCKSTRIPENIEKVLHVTDKAKDKVIRFDEAKERLNKKSR